MGNLGRRRCRDALYRRIPPLTLVLLIVLALSGCDLIERLIGGQGVDPVDPTPPNSAPTAVIRINPDNPSQRIEAGLEILFDASESEDPDDDGLSFEWTIYDQPGTQPIHQTGRSQITHKYNKAGAYIVVLRVSDGQLEGTCSVVVDVKPREYLKTSSQSPPCSDEHPIDWESLDKETLLSFRFSANLPAIGCRCASPVIRWSFGDGSSALGSVVSKEFLNPGTYDVAMTATCPPDEVTVIGFSLLAGMIPSSPTFPEIRFSEPLQTSAQAPENEYVTLANYSSTDVEMTGWSIESSNGSVFWFPSGFVLGKGETVSIHTGSGVSTSGTLYWGLSFPVWADSVGLATLRDPTGSVFVITKYYE